MIELGDITSAQRIIAGRVHRTPLMSSISLGRRTNTHLHFKAEVFQKTGSFKPRGAINKLHHLTEEERKGGVITISSGNHAQGLAYAASLFGISATVVMPHTTPTNKIDATRGYGAEVVLTEGDLLTTCLETQKEHNLTMVHPFDDPHIVAGQGTIGLEILDDLPEVDAVFVPIGGGGLISGIAMAIKLKKPAVKIVGVEPIGASAMWQSVQRKAVVIISSLVTFWFTRNGAFVWRFFALSNVPPLPWIENDGGPLPHAEFHSSAPSFENDATKIPGIHLHVSRLATT